MNYIINKEQYLAAKEAWKKSHSKSSTDHIIYNIIRGLEPGRGFTPVTKPSKLANGAESGLDRAKRNSEYLLREYVPNNIHTEERRAELKKKREDHFAELSKVWGIELTPELRQIIRGILK
jgi:hypothetical protein